jgi:hypothetical protein
MLKRANKPNAIAWLVREYPEMTDNQVGRLVGSTKPTVAAIRERTYWNMSNIAPASPVELGLCNLHDMQKEVDKALELRRSRSVVSVVDDVAETHVLGAYNVDEQPVID